MDFYLGMVAGIAGTLVTIPMVVIVVDWCVTPFCSPGDGR